MGSGLLQCVLQVALHHINRAGHKGRFGSEHEGQRIERASVGTERSRLRFLSKFGSGRILSLGQTVNAVVEHQDLDADVPAESVNSMVAADGKRIAVAGRDPDFKLGMGDLNAGGDSGCAAVNGMEPVGIHVIRKAAGAADAGYDDEFLARNSKLRKDSLNG